jgi:hypothetical protein
MPPSLPSVRQGSNFYPFVLIALHCLLDARLSRKLPAKLEPWFGISVFSARVLPECRFSAQCRFLRMFNDLKPWPISRSRFEGVSKPILAPGYFPSRPRRLAEPADKPRRRAPVPLVPLKTLLFLLISTQFHDNTT